MSGVVNEEGTHFLCKYKTLPNDEMEIVAPLGTEIEFVDNEIGSTYERDGKSYLKLKQLLAQNKKIWDEVHSGNVNPITLPTSMPAYTFLRIPSDAQMGTNPKKN